ncbi:MAG: hypothetical protein WDO74_17860 [Pseudomonadota bacterium]
MTTKTKPKGWTDADYLEKAGRRKLTMRLATAAIANLTEVSDASGITRQKILEAVLSDKGLLGSVVARMEKPLHSFEELFDEPGSSFMGKPD